MSDVIEIFMGQCVSDIERRCFQKSFERSMSHGGVLARWPIDQRLEEFLMGSECSTRLRTVYVRPGENLSNSKTHPEGLKIGLSSSVGNPPIPLRFALISRFTSSNPFR